MVNRRVFVGCYRQVSRGELVLVVYEQLTLTKGVKP